MSNICDLTPVEADVIRHCTKKYSRNPSARVKKLLEEVGELVEAIMNNDAAAIAEEAADCNVLLIDIASLGAGVGLEQATAAKLEIVKERPHE